MSTLLTTLYKYHLSHVVALMDYIPVSTLLRFAACETRVCVNITIVMDITHDTRLETFIVSLERTSSLPGRITLATVDGLVTILDDHGKFY